MKLSVLTKSDIERIEREAQASARRIMDKINNPLNQRKLRESARKTIEQVRKHQGKRLEDFKPSLTK